jgi:hypothetical protein
MTQISGSSSHRELPTQEAYTLPKKISQELHASPLTNKEQLVEQIRKAAHATSTVGKVLTLSSRPDFSPLLATMGSQNVLALAATVKESSGTQTASLSLVFPLAIASSLLEQDIAPKISESRKDLLSSVIKQVQSSEQDMKIIEKLLKQIKL